MQPVLILNEQVVPNIKQSLLYVSHFSFEKGQLAVVKDMFENYLVIKIAHTTKQMIMEDSVMLRYLFERKEFVLSGDVCEIIDEHTVKMVVTDISEYDNLRKEKRYPVSLQAVIALNDCLEFNCTTIKDISINGLKINCRFAYDLNSIIYIVVIFGKDLSLNLTGKIVRIKKVQDYFEYGVLIIKLNPHQYEILSKYVDELEENEKKFFNEHVDEHVVDEK